MTWILGYPRNGNLHTEVTRKVTRKLYEWKKHGENQEIPICFLSAFDRLKSGPLMATPTLLSLLPKSAHWNDQLRMLAKGESEERLHLQKAVVSVFELPSGNLLHSYGKWPIEIVDLPI